MINLSNIKAERIMEALELYKEETLKRKEIEAQENKTGKKVSGIFNFRRFVKIFSR